MSLPTVQYLNYGRVVSLDPTSTNPVTIGTVTVPGALTIADGGDTTQGTTTDAAVVDPTSTSTVVSLLKGILTFLITINDTITTMSNNIIGLTVLLNNVPTLVTNSSNIYEEINQAFDADNTAFRTETVTP